MEAYGRQREFSGIHGNPPMVANPHRRTFCEHPPVARDSEDNCPHDAANRQRAFFFAKGKFCN